MEPFFRSGSLFGFTGKYCNFSERYGPFSTRASAFDRAGEVLTCGPWRPVPGSLFGGARLCRLCRARDQEEQEGTR
jgi:hypothetical protein